MYHQKTNSQGFNAIHPWWERNPGDYSINTCLPAGHIQVPSRRKFVMFMELHENASSRKTHSPNVSSCRTHSRECVLPKTSLDPSPPGRHICTCFLACACSCLLAEDRVLIRMFKLQRRRHSPLIMMRCYVVLREASICVRLLSWGSDVDCL